MNVNNSLVVTSLQPNNEIEIKKITPTLSKIVSTSSLPVKVGIFKPYVTRKDNGLFPTQIDHCIEKILQDREASYKDERERVRVGWIDIPHMKCMLADIDQLAMVNLDLLTDVDEIYICSKYINVYSDEEIESMAELDEQLTVYYESFPAWKESLLTVDSFKDFPPRAKSLVYAIEHVLGKKITYFQIGNSVMKR